MANRFPLIVDASNQNIKELPDGDSLLLGDSEKLLLGDGTDLQLYHDGSNSYLANSTGALKLATESSGIAITIGHTTSETTIGDNLVVTGDLSIGGVTLPETISDTVGAMFSSNTETGIAATYQDGDNTIDLVIGANVVVAGMIAQNSILTRHIDDAQVVSSHIANNAILTQHIDDDQVTGDQLADTITVVTSVVTPLVDAAIVDGENFKVNGGQGSDGQILTSTGSGVAWEDAAGGGATFKEGGTNFTNSIMVGDDSTGTLNAATGNTGLGKDVFAALTSGDNNVAVGFGTMGALTTGYSNIAIGTGAFDSATTGHSSVAIGLNALTAVTEGFNNTAVGFDAGKAITTGDYNTALGMNAMNSGTTAHNNTVLGVGGGTSMTDAIGNTITGMVASIALTTGDYNVVSGYASGYAITTGDANVFIGASAGLHSTTGSNNIGIGTNALNGATTVSSQTAVGNQALRRLTSGAYNSAFGSEALAYMTTGQGNDAFGYTAGKSISTGGTNVVFGSFSMDSGGAQTGSGNTHIGHAGSRVLTSGYNNSSVGLSALAAATSGSLNVCVGGGAGSNITTGSNNTCIGYSSGQSNQPTTVITTQSNQIVVGNADHTNAHIQIDWTVASDKRDKTDVTPLDMGLSFINKLEPVTYKWDKRVKYEEGKTPDGTHKESWTDVGFLAQDVEKIEAEFGHKIEDETNLTTHMGEDGSAYGLTYAKFVPMLVKSVQELSTQVDELKSELLALKGE